MNDPEAPDRPQGRPGPGPLTILILTAFFCLGADGGSSLRNTATGPNHSLHSEGGDVSEAPLLSQDFFDTIPEVVSVMAADSLAEAIEHSRERASATAKPIPEKIRRALSPYFETAVLDRVRWTTDWAASEGVTLYRLVMANENVQAVTLDDTIVFREQRSAEDLMLWSHELKHVEQYGRWGIRQFAANYLLSHRRVEQEADDHAVAVYRSLIRKYYDLHPSERPPLP